MWLTRIFQYVAFKPMEAVGVIVALAVALAGAWLVSPFYSPDISVTAQVSGNLLTLPRILGFYQLTVGVVWAVAIFGHNRIKKSQSIRRVCSMLIFLLYAFYGISGVILHGVDRINYLSTFAIALISGIKYLHLSLVDVEDEDG